MRLKNGVLETDMSWNDIGMLLPMRPMYPIRIIARGLLPEKSDTKKQRKKFEKVVYFVRAGSRVKIGFTKDISSRMNSLQTASAVDLNLVLTMDGDRNFEAEMHERFSDYWIKGEWFRWCKEISLFVAKEKSRQKNPGLF